MWLIVWRKSFFLNIYPILLVWLKQFFKKIQIFLRICPFQIWWEKQTLWVFQCLFLRYSLLCLKRKVLYEFPQKCFKTTQRPSLSVCGSLFGEKMFLLIFIPFYWFDQKNCLNKSKFSSGFAPFQTWYEKYIFWVFQFSFFEIVTFLTKKRSSLWISPKMLQNNTKA